tara:strand:- start:31328 stop:32320 length:993 start_codon:yes stop_codon:yes gene_type:complete
MISLINKIKSLLKLISNYRKIKTKKNLLFFVYINPLVYFFLAIFAKIIIRIKNRKLTNFFLEKKIFISIIRLLTIKEKIYISNTLKSYNTINSVADHKNNISDKIEDLKINGYCSLGKLFSDQECDDFIKSLDNKICFNNQTVLQSDGKEINFKLNNDKYLGSISNYFCFLPNIVLNFPPVKKLLNDKKLKTIIDDYLNFKSDIYHCITFYNPISNFSHYVQNPHRDFDDWKHIQLTIYWNEINEKNGAMTFYKKSHNSNYDKKNKVELNGAKGEVFLIDTYGMHSANNVTVGSRFITFIRFAKYINKLNVVDGFLSTPTKDEIGFINYE